jgi:uncharacterized protein (TIGR02266 family)
MRNMPAVFREYIGLDRRRASPEGISVAEYQRWVELKRILNRHFQPGVQDTHADKRESVRVPVRLHMGFETYGEIRQSLMTNLSRGGLFIATPNPLEMGAKLQLRIRIEESQLELELEAEVASLNSGPGLLTEELGMGVKFVRLSEDQMKGVDDLYERSLRRAVGRD